MVELGACIVGATVEAAVPFERPVGGSRSCVTFARREGERKQLSLFSFVNLEHKFGEFLKLWFKSSVL